MKKIPQDIKQIDERLAALKKNEKIIRKSNDKSGFAYAAKAGLQVGVELLSGVIVGGAIGYILDMFLQTQPWFLVLFLFLGGGAGFLNVYRFAKAEGNKSKE